MSFQDLPAKITEKDMNGMDEYHYNAYTELRYPQDYEKLSQKYSDS